MLSAIILKEAQPIPRAPTEGHIASEIIPEFVKEIEPFMRKMLNGKNLELFIAFKEKLDKSEVYVDSLRDLLQSNPAIFNAVFAKFKSKLGELIARPIIIERAKPLDVAAAEALARSLDGTVHQRDLLELFAVTAEISYHTRLLEFGVQERGLFSLLSNLSVPMALPFALPKLAS
jgi:hypothetical protein